MKVIALLLLALLSLYGFALYSIFFATPAVYEPCWSDECVYYLNALSFAVNNSLNDAVIQNNVTSIIGGFGPHGFMCTLAGGLWMKAFGEAPTSLIALNFAYLLAAAGCIFCRKAMSLSDRLILCFAMLAPAYTFLYIGTLMQEILNVAFAAVLAALTAELSLVPHENKKAKWLLAIMLLVAALIRPNWLLLLAIFIPAARNRASLLKRGLLFIAGMALMFALFKLLFTTYPDGFLYRLGLYISAGEYANATTYFAQHLGTNCGQFFGGVNSDLFTNLYKALYIGLTVRLSLLWIRSRDAFAGGTALFSWLTLVLLMSLYDCLFWREVRFLGPVLPFLISATMLRSATRAQMIIAACCLLVLASSYSPAKQFFKEHVEAAQNIAAADKLKDEYQQLKSFVGSDKDVTVNLPLSVFAGDVWHLSLFPVNSSSGHHIRYSVAFDRAHLLSPAISTYVMTLSDKDAVTAEEKAHLREVHRSANLNLYAFEH